MVFLDLENDTRRKKLSVWEQSVSWCEGDAVHIVKFECLLVKYPRGVSTTYGGRDHVVNGHGTIDQEDGNLPDYKGGLRPVMLREETLSSHDPQGRAASEAQHEGQASATYRARQPAPELVLVRVCLGSAQAEGTEVASEAGVHTQIAANKVDSEEAEHPSSRAVRAWVGVDSTALPRRRRLGQA